MSSISNVDEQVRDLDWYALDQEGAIGHFTTGGRGALPRSVAASAQDLDAIDKFFRDQVPLITIPIVNPQLNSYADLTNSKERERYLRDYLEIVSRGLYSFDCKTTGHRPVPYFLVAGPETPLRLTNLPEHIQIILKRTVLPGVVFAQVAEVKMESLA